MPPTLTQPPTKTTTETPLLTKRAFSYLRVSSDGQVKTDYSDEGLSINAQREGVREKALSLDAEIAGEFSDPGRSAYVDLHKRTGFLAMLDELKQRNRHASTRVDYVIVWALSRWARNTVDHWQTRAIIREAGARLVSITEPMAGEDSAAAFLYESMIATHNQFQSMQTGENVKRGLKQKASVGGTYGWAPVGYLNDVDNLPDGRRVAIVTIDPERGPYVTLAFQLYASGEYSISQLAAELKRLGLRSRPARSRRSTTLGTSVLQRLLRNRYYTGKIVYKRGTPDEQTFDGRHEPLIDEDTFEAVQRLLDEKQVAGERPRKHKPYLRGTAYCGECGARLAYGVSTGRNGQPYPYFFCVGRVNGSTCSMRTNIRPELIEQAIQRYYVERPVQLTADDVAKRTEAIEALVGVSQAALTRVQQAKTQLIRSLEARQDDLLDMRFGEESISPDLFKRRQEQLQTELDAAHESLAESEQRLKIEAEQLRMALELAENIAQVYAEGNEQTKRGYNQAFFKKLYVLPEWDEDHAQTVVRIVRAELTEPYATLLADDLAEAVLAEAEAIKKGTNAKDGPGGEPSSAGVSYYERMAERAGFEPAMEV
jgi:site-specific DNA recombinase